jgi:RNA polymerase sigma-70 factor (ECF subfamily)
LDAAPLQPTDAQLIAGVIEGEDVSLETLMARYSVALKTVLQRALGPGPEWEDVAQETWMRVVRYAHRYDPTYAFSTWLFRVAWNVALTRIGKRPPEIQDPEAFEPADDAPHAEAGLLKQERDKEVRTSIAALPPALAEAVLLRHFEDLSERDMSARLGIPAGTVKSRLHHAHRRLALLLGGSE